MDRSTPRRSPENGGYARGEEKRIRIIEAALKRFGTDGFLGASTRQIAKDADVNPPAIQYYFSGKDGLYLACAKHFASVFQNAMESFYQRAEAVSSDPEAAIESLCDLFEALIRFLLDYADQSGWSEFLARYQSNNDIGPSDPALNRAVGFEFHAHCRRLVAIAMGKEPTDMPVIIKTIAIIGQAHPFHSGRDLTLQKLGWPDFSEGRLELLQAILREQTRTILAHDSQMTKRPPSASGVSDFSV